MKVINTACPRNCYSSCSFQVEMEADQIRGFQAQPLNLSTPEGPCLKGLSYLERITSKDRILHPMAKINGSFKKIDWDEAYALIIEKLKEYKNEFGPHSILFYAASGTAGLLNEVSSNFWKMFGGATSVYGNLCWPAGLEATNLTLGANKHNLPEDLENANLIVLWGKNPAETNIHQMPFIHTAKESGAKVMVIDPRRTITAESADLLLQPVPGTDAVLALTMARIIIDENLHNAEFIGENVKGFKRFFKSLEKIKPEESANTCGIPLSMIKKAAHWIGTIAPMTLIPGYGMQRFSNGGQSIRCLLALSVITGNIGKKGGCWHYANLQSYVFDSIKEPESYYPDPKKDFPFRREIPTALLGKNMMELKDPELKMAWIERGNPIAQNPDSNLIKKAFGKLEFIVVVEQFLTDTAEMADLLLPAKSLFEQSDIIGSYWNPYVQLKQKIIAPPADVKPETTIYYEMAQLLDFDKNEIEKMIPNPSDEAIELWLKKYVNKYPELSWEKLKQGPILAPGLEKIPFSDGVFPTPSGKIELYSEQARQKWGLSPLPVYNPIIRRKDGKYPLQLMSPNTKNRIHSQFGNLQMIKDTDEGPYANMNPVDAYDRDIKMGEMVRIFNDNGELSIKIKFDPGLRPGNVLIYNGYWHSEGASPNSLTIGAETDMGHGTAFHDHFVEVEIAN